MIYIALAAGIGLAIDFGCFCYWLGVKYAIRAQRRAEDAEIERRWIADGGAKV